MPGFSARGVFDTLRNKVAALSTAEPARCGVKGPLECGGFANTGALNMPG